MTFDVWKTNKLAFTERPTNLQTHLIFGPTCREEVRVSAAVMKMEKEEVVVPVW